MSTIRCGIGYDIHRLGQNRKLILGGVEIPYLLGLEGHSDADVLSHAIADALLGAICVGDIGQHFPNTDESIRGISSIEILKRVNQLLADKKTRIVNIDATVIAEAPKLGPQVPEMRKKIAATLGISDSASQHQGDHERAARPDRSRGRNFRDGSRNGRARLMALRFFNTYSRQVEEFQPRTPKKVDMYTCGPTVYSRAHIGNFRAYIFEDLLQRHLEARGFKVHRVMNITDVDDKTIRGAREAKVPLQKFTQQFKEAFFKDAETLRIKRADEYPSATDQRYIEKMIAMIGALISKGLAYQADDKSVYYRINKFPNYGKLAHLDLAELKPSGRVQHDEYDKEHIGDFALWKAWDEDDGDVKWDSPWGPGRPGWHIECSAMATTIARRPARHPLRRRGQHLPTSRSGDCAKRRRDRKKVRELLAALRAFTGRRPENGEVAGKFLHRARCSGKRLYRSRNALRANARALSDAIELHLGRNERSARVAWTHRRLAGATARIRRRCTG